MGLCAWRFEYSQWGEPFMDFWNLAAGLKIIIYTMTNVVLCSYRRWVIFHSRFWKRCLCGRSWCSIRVTMKIAVHTSPSNPKVLSVRHSLCCPQCVGVGIRLCLDGQNQQQGIGCNINWGSRFDVCINFMLSVQKFVSHAVSIVRQETHQEMR